MLVQAIEDCSARHRRRPHPEYQVQVLESKTKSLSRTQMCVSCGSRKPDNAIEKRDKQDK